MRLRIKQSSWSGWSKDYKPKEIENNYEIENNKKYIIQTREFSFKKDGEWVKEEREIFSFEINEINTDSITIHSFQPFSDSENGVNLQSNKQDFTIKINEPLKLVTTTMDQGEICILTLI